MYVRIPTYTVPEVLECGCCLAGDKRELVVQVENSGGEGRFLLCHVDTLSQQVSIRHVQCTCTYCIHVSDVCIIVIVYGE